MTKKINKKAKHYLFNKIQSLSILFIFQKLLHFDPLIPQISILYPINTFIKGCQQEFRLPRSHRGKAFFYNKTTIFILQ